MNTIKPYLLIALVLLCHISNAQIFRGQYFNPIKGNFSWEQGRFVNQTTLPYRFYANADTGSVSFVNNKFYGKKLVNGVETWVPLLDSLSALTTEISDIYQYSTNVNVTVGDTTTALELNGDGSNTDNRVVTLKSPSEHTGKSLKIFNYNAGSYINSLASAIIDFDGSESTVLDNQSTYLLSSDGTHWKVVSKTKQVTGGGPGGSGGGGIIVNLD